MKAPWSNLSGLPKGLVICSLIFLVASGLCKLQLATMNRVADGVSSIFVLTGIVELIAMTLSSIGIAGILLTLLGRLLYRLFTKKSVTQKNAVEENDQNRDPRQ